jgi:hypothetical protein
MAALSYVDRMLWRPRGGDWGKKRVLDGRGGRDKDNQNIYLRKDKKQ